MNNFDKKKENLKEKTTKENINEEIDKIKETLIYILEIIKTRNF